MGDGGEQVQSGDPAPSRRGVGTTGSALRSSVHIAVGVAIGHGALVLASPVLSRLYSPEEFGILAVFSGTLSVIAAMAAGGFDQSVPLPRKASEAAGLVVLGIIASTLSAGAAVMLAAWWLRAGLGATSVGAAMPSGAAWLLGLGVLLIGCQRTLYAWTVREGTHRIQAQGRAVAGLLHAGTQLGLGWAGFGASGLLTGEAIGRGGGVIRTLPAWLRSLGRDVRPPLREAWRGYRRYPALVVPAATINALGLQAPPVVIAWLYGEAEAGHLAIALLALGAPVMLASVAVGQVYLGRLAQARREQPAECGRIFRRTSVTLAGAAAVLVVVGCIPAPWTFPLVFGDRWHEAGIYALLLAPLFLAQMGVSPLAQTVYVMGRLKTQLAWDIARVLALAVVFFFAHRWQWDPRLTIAAYAGTMAALYLILYRLYRGMVIRQTGSSR